MKNIYLHLLLFLLIRVEVTGNTFSKQNLFLDLGENYVTIQTANVIGSDGDPLSTSLVNKSKNEKRGDKYYFVYSYTKAIEAYTGAKELSVEGQRKLAKSYYSLNQNDLGKQAYAKLISMEGGNLSQDYFDYAMVLKALGNYEEASRWMNLFAEMAPNDLRAKSYLRNSASLVDIKSDNGRYKIENLNINTSAQDFCPAFYQDKLVFASSRTSKLFPKKSYRNGMPYLNIYVADLSNNQMVDPQNFDKKLNGNMNDGPACFTKDGLFMAFTKNNYNLTKTELIVNVEIYFRTFADSEWSLPEAFNANSIDYSVAQPCLSNNGATMYFSSNMPGGYGGADIYSVSKGANGVWNNPVNLGSAINTEGDEVFPFFEEGRDVLFFSSNGLFGLGGLDIFSSVMKGSEYSDAFNAGAPLNTSSDDFSIIVDSTIHKGYFSSNRSGGKGDDDIYSVEFLTTKKINGMAKDANNHQLSGTFITLLDNKNQIVDTMTTKQDGLFEFQIKDNSYYQIIGTKSLYRDGKTNVNASGTELLLRADVLLEPLVIEKIVKVEVKTEVPVIKPVKIKSPMIPLFSPIYFDYHEYTLRRAATIELDKIVAVLNENPDMRLELAAHTDCRSSRAYNQNLSNKRAKASADYLRKRIKNPERVTAKGYGETQLKNNCECEGEVTSICSEEEHQENRRTDFVISKTLTLNK